MKITHIAAVGIVFLSILWFTTFSVMALVLGLVFFFLLWLNTFNYLSGKNFLLDIWHYYSTTSKSLQYWDDFCETNKNKSDVIVSLSTIPSRISEIVPTLKSLLAQKRAPKKIHLYVPELSMREQVGYNIPKEIEGLKCLEVIRTEKDWGPSTKFIPAVETLFPDQKILVVDDDNMYPRNMLRDFDKASDDNPDWMLTSSGWRVPEDLVDRDSTFWANVRLQAPVPVPTTRVNDYYPIDIVQGYSGFLIRPRFFDLEELKNYPEEPIALKYVDDVWVSAHAKAPKYVLPSRRFCYTPFWKTDFFKANSLASINNHGKENDEDRNNSIALRYFKDKWSK
ncbi:MAG: hypothetical protein R8N23_11090 [Reichenbachiella sp.]|uniref:hypothetical protein n=1 Tax=Reichenbachiella sp. TaxID=2184521 RepID=UPI0029662CB3|nr:hypothetical protein [Reichenbachiella sp.]MDW3210406.1 hypothetical protein [Reichenbachiella sp.]